MNGILDNIVTLLQQGIAVVADFIRLIWSWSFGQMLTIFESDWHALPFGKQIVFGLSALVIALILFRALTHIWGAIVGLLSAILTVLPHIAIAGLVAFGGSWIIQNVAF